MCAVTLELPLETEEVKDTLVHLYLSNIMSLPALEEKQTNP